MSLTRIEYITSICPEYLKIERPKILGKIHDIYIVTCPTQKIVFRFSTEQLAHHNQFASRFLKNTKVKTPNISVYRFDSDYCEVYPFISGKTLYERIQEGISKEKLDKIYIDIIKYLSDISSIKIDKTLQTKLQSPIVPEKTTEKTVIDTYFKLLNTTNKSICHTDLQAKNILLDDKDNLYAVLDLDNISFDYLSVALLRVINDADKNGYNKNYFDTIIKHTPVLHNFYRQLKLYFCMRKIYRTTSYIR